MKRYRGCSLVSVLVFLQLAASPESALAQRATALERNLPPPAQTPHSDLAPQPIVPTGDDTPLGIDIAGIRLFGLTGAVEPAPERGIVVDGIDGLPAAALEKAVRPFIGQPLSQRLIVEARSAVVAAHRAAGRPFVSVTAPPQEVTGGVLQLQIVPYRIGAVKTLDPDSGPEPDIGAVARESWLRARAGELIDSARLSEDIDWLNRFPYRQINGVFEPGSRPGETDLTLNITRQKPWRVYAGYANSGSKGTGYDRYFVGFSAGVEALHDLTLSYQLTGSENLWAAPSKGRLVGNSWPAYISHAGRIAIPTFPRQGIEIAPNFVATRQETSDRVLSFRNVTFELPVVYRSALSNIWQDAPSQSEVYGGVAFKWAERHTSYDIINLARGQSATFNVMLGLSRYWQGADGSTNSLDVRAVANPGGVLPGNTGRVWSTQTNGRVDSAQYVYGLLQFDRSLPLGAIAALRDFSLNMSLSGIVSGQALPDTEQLSLGGASATRGYSSSSGATDAGFVLRNELRLPSIPLLRALGGAAGQGEAPSLSPYLFADLGYGHLFSPGDTTLTAAGSDDTTLVGVGGGVDVRMGGNLFASLSGGWALKATEGTRRGDFAANVRVSLTY